jgi:hypothetical protein
MTMNFVEALEDRRLFADGSAAVPGIVITRAPAPTPVQSPPSQPTTQPAGRNYPVPLDSRFFWAVAEKESNQNANVRDGDGGRAVGILQMWKSVVDDVNRVYKTSYTYADRRDVHQSYLIFVLYLDHWGEVYQRQTGQYATYATYATIWHRGPGARNTVDQAYWNSVKNNMNRLYPNALRITDDGRIAY